MATQFKDGSFSETKPFEEALDDFTGFAKAGQARSFHVGTEFEIEQQKQDSAAADQIKELQLMQSAMRKDMDAIMEEKMSSLAKASSEEIEKFGKGA